MEQTRLFPSKVAEVYRISYDWINSPVFASEKAARKFLTKKSPVKPWVNSVWSYKPSADFSLEQYIEKVPAGFSLAGAVVFARSKEHEWGYYLCREDAETQIHKVRRELGFTTIIVPVLKLDDIKKE